jgi:uncharacterized Tic20 family protein
VRAAPVLSCSEAIVDIEPGSEQRNWALGLADLILVIIAAIQVSDGKAYRYPYCLRLVK